MSVIGRLDEQVNAVLITPLEKRGEHTEDAATQDVRARERPVPSAKTKGQEPGGDDNNKMSEQETPARPSELPVWLL